MEGGRREGKKKIRDTILWIRKGYMVISSTLRVNHFSTDPLEEKIDY